MNYYSIPSESTQLNAFFCIALAVALYLLFPECGVALWHDKVSATFVAVPEATVYEDDCLVLAQHNVGCAGKSADIYPVTVAVSMQVAAYDHLGLGVPVLDVRHTPMSLFFGHLVCHSAKIHVSALTTSYLWVKLFYFSKLLSHNFAE